MKQKLQRTESCFGSLLILLNSSINKQKLSGFSEERPGIHFSQYRQKDCWVFFLFVGFFFYGGGREAEWTERASLAVIAAI